MYPNYRTTAAHRRRKLLRGASASFVALVVVLWIFMAYAAFHFVVKYW